MWENLVKDWSAQEKKLLRQSWRESTLLTYRAPIRRWIRWCENKHIDPKTSQGQDLASFLADLSITEKLAYNTILLHKSAIATFCAGNKATSLSSDFLVRQVLKEVSITRPREVKSPIWDAQMLLDWLSTPTDNLTFFKHVSHEGMSCIGQRHIMRVFQITTKHVLYAEPIHGIPVSILLMSAAMKKDDVTALPGEHLEEI